MEQRAKRRKLGGREAGRLKNENGSGKAECGRGKKEGE